MNHGPWIYYVYIYIHHSFCPLCTRSPSWRFSSQKLRTVNATEVLWLPPKLQTPKTHLPTAMAVLLSREGGIWAFLSLKPQCAQLISVIGKHHSFCPLCTRSPSWRFSSQKLRTVNATEVLWLPPKLQTPKTHLPTAMAVLLSTHWILWLCQLKNKERSIGAASCRNLTRCLAKSERLCIKVWAATSWI